jgi:uracil-DNA glycosylase
VRASTLLKGDFLSLEKLHEQVISCRKCRLWQCAKQAVPGEGPVNAQVILVGQNPGAEEDKVGKPFVGRAGKFLNKVLDQNFIERQGLFVTNIVKRTSPCNRKPFPDEVEACAPYLTTQVELIKPRIVMLMGAVAWQTHRIVGVEYFETVHPSAAMRFTKMRRRFEADFATLAKRLQET